ncbi:MAG: InlB B-repeat-containing protein [Paludibacteraceae bacterium]|nr:InlB B-repeat-containing protein [Paludibacteraceae bacterium]
MKKLFLSIVALCAATTMFANFAAQRDSIVTCGDQVKIVAQPKEGQHFMYWSDLTKDHADYSKTERWIEVVSDTTIRAIFQINRYEIKWYQYDGTFIVKDSTDYGVTPTFPEDKEIAIKPANQQYTYSFKGWGDATYTYTNGMQPAKNDTAYYAVMDSVVNQYTLTYAVDPTFAGTITGSVVYGGETVESVSGTKYYYGSTVTLTAEADDACYQFVGWFKSDDLDGTAVSTDLTYEFELQDNVSLVAKFEKKTFTVTVIADPDTMGDVDIMKP